MEPDKEFVHAYGLFLLKWTSFTTMIELLLTKELGIPHIKGHIVCQSATFGNQLNMLKTLLDQKTPPDLVGQKMISSIVNHAKRNYLAHGLVNIDIDSGNVIFIKRDVRTELKVAELRFSNDDFKEHIADFLMKYHEIKTHFSISDEDIDIYVESARTNVERTNRTDKTVMSKRKKQQEEMRIALRGGNNRIQNTLKHQSELIGPMNDAEMKSTAPPPSSMLKKLLGIKS